MALKKSELYSSLWQSCDELRGGMDASQYKDYVLVLLFVKYISDRFAGQPFAAITVPEGASFADMVARKGKSDIGDQINKKANGRTSYHWRAETSTDLIWAGRSEQIVKVQKGLAQCKSSDPMMIAIRRRIVGHRIRD